MSMETSLKWIETTKNVKKRYRRRFRYFETLPKGECQVVYFRRVTRVWYRPIENVGFFVERIVLKLHNFFGEKRELTERDYAEAKQFSKNGNTTEREFLKRFASINPYSKKGWSTVLWWIRENILFT